MDMGGTSDWYGGIKQPLLPNEIATDGVSLHNIDMLRWPRLTYFYTQFPDDYSLWDLDFWDGAPLSSDLP